MKFLKGTILLFVVLLSFLKCTKSDKTETATPKSHFNPPAWIQGTWLIEDGVGAFGYRFTENDLLTIGFGEISNNKLINEQEKNGSWKPTVKETIGSSTYHVELNRQGMNIVYNFRLVDAKHICDDIDSLGCDSSAFYAKR